MEMYPKLRRISISAAYTLAEIRRFMAETGIPPTRADLSKRTGFAEPNIRKHLMYLEYRMFISVYPNVGRGIVLLKPVEELTPEYEYYKRCSCCRAWYARAKEYFDVIHLKTGYIVLAAKCKQCESRTNSEQRKRQRERMRLWQDFHIQLKKEDCNVQNVAHS